MIPSRYKSYRFVAIVAPLLLTLEYLVNAAHHGGWNWVLAAAWGIVGMLNALSAWQDRRDRQRFETRLRDAIRTSTPAEE